jgi:hypothetical protein
LKAWGMNRPSLQTGQSLRREQREAFLSVRVIK